MQDENLDKNKSLVVKRSSKLVVMSSKRNRLITRAINEALDFIPISFITDEELDGPRLKKYSDGSSYYGQFKGQTKHGFGTYTSEDGDEYIGNWQYDERHGQGTENYADGNVYIGQFKGNDRHGYGTYTWDPDGDLGGRNYVGDWEDGVIHGAGVYTLASGETYDGEYSDGLTQRTR